MQYGNIHKTLCKEILCTHILLSMPRGDLRHWVSQRRLRYFFHAQNRRSPSMQAIILRPPRAETGTLKSAFRLPIRASKTSAFLKARKRPAWETSRSKKLRKKSSMIRRLPSTPSRAQRFHRKRFLPPLPPRPATSRNCQFSRLTFFCIPRSELGKISKPMPKSSETEK